MKKLIFLFLVLCIPLAIADDEYKPYLHKPNIPESPGLELYGSYSTSLFPGAATYSYDLSVMPGTNGLQPQFSLSYNSQSTTPSVLGRGWQLTENVIYRDVNLTPQDTSDDVFVLVLGGSTHELHYDEQDGFYHTEIETFFRIQNLSTTTNTLGTYWLVTLKDGTQLRFGHTTESELVSSSFNYVSKWSLDQISDTHNNKIFYHYLKNPYQEDNGTVYLSKITYNNDQKRKILFAYEHNQRPDHRITYQNGNFVTQSRRLTDITLFFNDSFVSRYHFSFKSLNQENSTTSLSGISLFGNDNSSVLHNVSFHYAQSTSDYDINSGFSVPVLFASSSGADQGVRLLDVNNDGYVDVVQGKSSTKQAWLNNKSDWNETTDFVLPQSFVNSMNEDEGLRIADLNTDGFPDLIQGYASLKRSWLNNGSGWSRDTTWDPPIVFLIQDGPVRKGQGVRFADINGDGKIDLLQAKETLSNKTYLNNGSGWKDASSTWHIPTYFARSDGSDHGTRLVDINGDGLVDLLQGYDFGTTVKKAYLNTGNGWVENGGYAPPKVFTSTSTPDTGARLTDVNGDGLVDILVDYVNSSSIEKLAYINTGHGWAESVPWQSPDSFTHNGKNTGRRIADVNGDGFGDILVGYINASSPVKKVWLRNKTFPYLLDHITNEFGGKTLISYTPSTSLNNTKEDGRSDIGFNVWVVKNVTQDNGMNGDFLVNETTVYSYYGGHYDYNDSEFRGFSTVNETFPDNSIISHKFFQNDRLKGKEFQTTTYDDNNNILLRKENNYNTTENPNSSYFSITLLYSSTFIFDGDNDEDNALVTNVTYEYDTYGNVVVKNTAGNVNVHGDEKTEQYSFVYNTSEWIVDKVSHYQLFDENNNKIRKITYFYDNKLVGLTKGDLTTQEEWLDDGTGNPVTSYNYDSFGNPYRQTDPLGHTVVFYYGTKDATNTFPDRRVNELGHAIDYSYDVATGNILSETKHGVTFFNEYDAFGRITKEIQPYDTIDLPTKEYTYDFDGIAPEVIKVSQKTTSNNTLDTYYFYDGFANLVQIKTPSEHNKHIIKNIFYDGLGRVKEEQNPYFDSFSTSLTTPSVSEPKTSYHYDALSRITKVTNPDNTQKNTIYNKNMIKDFDENNNFKTYHLDAHDRIIAVEEHNTDFYLGDSETYNTTYSYNGADELVGIRDHLGNTFNFTYNSLGQKIRLNDPDLGTWQYGYDFAGNLISQEDNKGNSIVMSYDGLNRITHKNTSNQTISFGYDVQYQGTLHNISKKTTEIGDENYTYVYTYDDRLRVTKEIMHADDQLLSTGSTYDSFDRIVERQLPNGNDLDFYYNKQGLSHRIQGYINQTTFNPFGNPLNRTYFNNKLTEFTYNADNARLQQIKTDSIQNLNYSYDHVGNIMEIDDSANSRLYSMSYDNLDRLTNVSIGAFKWTYSFDPLGNILKIVRNHSETTAFKFASGLAHAPSKVITFDTGAGVHKEDDFNSTGKTKVVQFYLVNDKNATLTDVNWSAEFGDGNPVHSNQPFNLSVNDNILTIVEHTYSSGSNYRVNVSSLTNGVKSDYETLSLLFGSYAQGLDILEKNATVIVSEFTIKNLNNDFSQDWDWNCDNGVTSTVDFNMSAHEDAFVVMEHNYTLNDNQVRCTVNSTDGNQSVTLPLAFDGVEIEGFNSTLSGDSGIQVQFQIKNYFDTLDVEWNISAGDQFAQSSSPITLTQGEATTVIQTFNFTTRGVKKFSITAYSDDFVDTYAQNTRLYSLDLKDFLNVIKNGTTRVFNFIIQNDWTQLTAFWNVSDPVVENTVNLSFNESMIVIIEEDYGQGRKEVDIELYNQSKLEDKITEVFVIKQIGIDELETVHEGDRVSVIQALVVNNVNPLNVSWTLNNSQDLISSSENFELDTDEQAIVIIESNYDEEGVYPVNFQINSSMYGDNVTGVSIS